MSILKAKSQSKLSKFMGVFLPPWIQQYLNLYALAKGITKSEIVRGQIERWLKEQPLTSELLLEIINKLQEEWDSKKDKGENITFYIDEVKRELIHKGVNDDNIQMIINGIK